MESINHMHNNAVNQMCKGKTIKSVYIGGTYITLYFADNTTIAFQVKSENSVNIITLNNKKERTNDMKYEG